MPRLLYWRGEFRDHAHGDGFMELAKLQTSKPCTNHNHPVRYLAEHITRMNPLSLLFEQQPNYLQGIDTLSEILEPFGALSLGSTRVRPWVL